VTTINSTVTDSLCCFCSRFSRLRVAFVLLSYFQYSLHYYNSDIETSVIIIIKNEKIRVTLCENAAGALYIVNMPRPRVCRTASFHSGVEL